jgi:hypothetical protein
MTTETKQELIDDLKRRVEEIRKSLEAAVLDGTPFLLVAQLKDQPMFYAGGRKFRPLAILDWHCCGAVSLGSESVQESIRRLEAKGIKAWALHQRQHAQNVLAEVQGYIDNLTALGA